jgi:hypothetical protein
LNLQGAPYNYTGSWTFYDLVKWNKNKITPKMLSYASVWATRRSKAKAIFKVMNNFKKKLGRGDLKNFTIS